MIGRGERFCEVVVCLSRDEDEDEDGKFGKRGWWEDQEGEKGKGEREDGAWWLVTYLTCIFLLLYLYEMRYMSMIMSMNMNTYLMRMSHSLVVRVQYSLLGFFCFCTTGR